MSEQSELSTTPERSRRADRFAAAVAGILAVASWATGAATEASTREEALFVTAAALWFYARSGQVMHPRRARWWYAVATLAGLAAVAHMVVRLATRR